MYIKIYPVIKNAGQSGRATTAHRTAGHGAAALLAQPSVVRGAEGVEGAEGSAGAMVVGNNDNVYWRLRLVSNRGSKPNGVIGWAGGNDALTQLALTFATLAEAEAEAKKIGLPARVVATLPQRKVEPKNYADNFSYRRLTPWTH